jgi:hypothetical protein
MLDYAKIAKSKGYTYGNLDETIAFLQSCSCQSKLTLPFMFYFSFF